jgi:hypothetical protein
MPVVECQGMYRGAKLCVLVQFRGGAKALEEPTYPPCFFHKPVGRRRRRVTGWRMIGETRSTDRSNDGDSKQPASSDRDSFRHATPRPSRAPLVAVLPHATAAILRSRWVPLADSCWEKERKTTTHHISIVVSKQSTRCGVARTPPQQTCKPTPQTTLAR